MNQRDAKQQGFNDGREYQAKCHRDNVLTQTQYNKDGEHHLNVIARFAHFKTRNLYFQGWIEAWQEPKQPEPVKHFESRFDFCTCEACNAKRASL